MLYLLLVLLLAQNAPSPRQTKNVPPVYPREAMASGAQGMVLIEVTIDARGKVSNAVVKRSIPPLDAAALAAVRQWEFEPTIVDGKAVSRVATVSVNFAIRNAPPTPATALSGPKVPESPSRARALFDEARNAIARVPSQPDTPFPIDTRPLTRATLFVELSKAEAAAFPEQAAEDAERGFALAQSFEGTAADLDNITSGLGDVAARLRAAPGWMAKSRIEPDAVRVLVAANHAARARELARSGDFTHATLYEPIIRIAPGATLLTLANECRSSDGSYPYSALADRARMMTDDSERRELLVSAYRTAASETTYPNRAAAQALLQRTWDLLPPDVVARTLMDTLNAIIAQPANVPIRNVPDTEMFGPWILELLGNVDAVLAARVASEHPEWDAARRTPGRTPGNPAGGPGGPFRPAAPPPPALLRPNGILPRLPEAEFERLLAQAREEPVTQDKIQRLIGLGYSLLP